MNAFAKIAIAAAALLVVAVVAINMLSASGGGLGGPARSPSPVPSPSPSGSPTQPPTPSPTPAAVVPAAGELAAGAHSFVMAGVPFSLTVPSGWTSNGEFGIDRGDVGPDGAGFIFWSDSPDGVYSDPCAQVQALPVGPSADDLALALTTIPGTDVVSGPSDVTVGGRPAMLVVLTIREDIDCGAGTPLPYLWYDAASSGRYATQLGSTIRVWIIDAPGGRVWIDGETYLGATAEAEQELMQIVDSIEFD